MNAWTKRLFEFAPALAASLATANPGPLAAKALSVVAEALGVEATETAIGNAVQAATPDQVAKLRELDLEFAKIDLERDKALLADTDSARKMQEKALEQADLFSKRFVYYFIAGWSVFAGIYIAAITFLQVPVENQRVVDTILGFLLGTALAGCFSYLLGSSLGSVRSAQTLRDVARGAGSR